ncbi:MAG: hypothetical protein A2Y73_01990 [Chloroflexi bacterium RBG_13_56_8]|nr:MAG: hypothetical protein A2Y73_01990 [Chloroflexi bacterium RBG_13_56_8]
MAEEAQKAKTFKSGEIAIAVFPQSNYFIAFHILGKADVGTCRLGKKLCAGENSALFAQHL